MSGTITEITGVKIGHFTDSAAGTGCTVVLLENGAAAGVDVRGAAPGTRETDLLRGYNAVDRIQAVLLTGGSAYGLDAAGGVMRYLEERGLGTDVGVGVVPIVPAAVIFDLAYGSAAVRPRAAEGYEACLNASREGVRWGSVGAGTGATFGKAFGLEYMDKGGVGTSCITLDGGVKVGAVAVVNALGNVYDPQTGRILGGASRNGEYLSLMDGESEMRVSPAFGNTTIGVVATNAALSREQANKLASMAHDGLAMTIRPVHTALDGDTFFAVSTGEIRGAEFMPVMVAAVNAAAGAVIHAVRAARGEG